MPTPSSKETFQSLRQFSVHSTEFYESVKTLFKEAFEEESMYLWRNMMASFDSWPWPVQKETMDQLFEHGNQRCFDKLCEYHLNETMVTYLLTHEKWPHAPFERFPPLPLDPTAPDLPQHKYLPPERLLMLLPWHSNALEYVKINLTPEEGMRVVVELGYRKNDQLPSVHEKIETGWMKVLQDQSPAWWESFRACYEQYSPALQNNLERALPLWKVMWEKYALSQALDLPNHTQPRKKI